MEHIGRRDRALIESILFGKSENTRKAAIKHLTRFLKSVGKTIDTVTEEDIVYYLTTALSGKKEAARLLLTYLAACLRRAGRQELARRCDELRKGIRFREEERRRNILSKEELALLMPVLWRHAHERTPRGDSALALLLMLSTGLRLSEALSSEVASIEGRVIVTRGKGGKMIYKKIIDEKLWSAIASRMHRGRLFKASPTTVQRWFKRFLKEAGIPKSRIKALRTHDLRRTAAFIAYSETRDLEAVRAWLGHSKPETTTLYLGRGILAVESEKYMKVSEHVSKTLSTFTDESQRA